jgi:23S rRNA pseudouridine1911/1915/1917 synthase
MPIATTKTTSKSTSKAPTRSPTRTPSKSSPKAQPKTSSSTSKIDQKIISKTVPFEYMDERVDIVLVKLFELSRAKVRQYIDSGMVFLNKKRIWIAKYAVSKGDLLEVNTDNGDKKVVEFDHKNIMFENENFLIVNKPAGMVVEDTNHKYPIFDAIRSLTAKTKLKVTTKPSLENLSPGEEFFIVHRIDKETSGLLIIAKNFNTQKELIKLWSDKKVQKFYQCLTFGVPRKLQGNINSNIGQHGERNQYATGKSEGMGGKTALTNYKVNAVLNKGMASIINCEPKTGRSHQIRVHLASIDCPLLGDKIYSNKYKLSPIFTIANRQMLHASQLIFELYGVKYNFHAPVPSDFNQLVKYIKTAKHLQIDKKDHTVPLKISATTRTSPKPNRKVSKYSKSSDEQSEYPRPKYTPAGAIPKSAPKSTKLRASKRRTTAVSANKKAIFSKRKASGKTK